MNQERGLVTLNVQYYTLQSSNSRHLIGQRCLLRAARVRHASQNVFRIFPIPNELFVKKKKENPPPRFKSVQEKTTCVVNLVWHRGLHLLLIDSDFSFCVPSECSRFMRIADVVGTAVLFPL